MNKTNKLSFNKLNIVKKHFQIAGLLILLLHFSFGQEQINNLSLNEAYKLLENRYPALQDDQIINDIYQREQSKLTRDRLPQLSFKTEGNLQSERPSFDLPAGSTFPFEIDLPLYSAKSYLEVKFNIFDGGLKRAQNKLNIFQLKADLQNVEVDRYALRQRVNQLFLNIVVLREQNKLFDISINDLQTSQNSISAAVDEGAVLESEIDKLRVKELEVRSEQDNVIYKLIGSVNTLSQLLGVRISRDVNLGIPTFSVAEKIPVINRPEQKLFQLKQDAILASEDIINARRKPKLNLFAQGGIGYPNPLNIFDNEAATFGIVGIQFAWLITDWKKTKLDKEILKLNTRLLQNAQNTFEFNLKTRESNYLAEFERLRKQLIRDDEIAELQFKILKQVSFQLDEGLITSSEYLSQFNAELKAQQNILLHQAELLKIQVEFWNERGGK